MGENLSMHIGTPTKPATKNKISKMDDFILETFHRINVFKNRSYCGSKEVAFLFADLAK